MCELRTLRARRAKAWLLGLGALAATACAHFGEAFGERVSGPASGRFERVELVCAGDRAVRRAPPRARLQLGPVSGPGDQRNLLSVHAFVPESASGELVGEVFGRGTGGLSRFQAPFPLGVTGGLLGAQLASEATARLRAIGVQVESAPQALALDIARVWVASSPGSFFELKGHLLAEVAWTATAREADGRALWQRSFATRVERRIAYAYARDHESALREAWCAALDRFQEAAAAELAPLLPALR